MVNKFTVQKERTKIEKRSYSSKNPIKKISIKISS